MVLPLSSWSYLALLVVVIARGMLRANQHISLCFDETDHDYIKDDKAREAACK
jgi:hypothetical protein